MRSAFARGYGATGWRGKSAELRISECGEPGALGAWSVGGGGLLSATAFDCIFGESMKSMSPEMITLARFSELLGTRFRVWIGSTDATEIELVQATPGGTFANGGAKVPQYESFSLLFHGAQARPLQQGTYVLEHPQAGKFDLFIVPIAAEQGMIHYQAVFNRLVKPA